MLAAHHLTVETTPLSAVCPSSHRLHLPLSSPYSPSHSLSFVYSSLTSSHVIFYLLKSPLNMSSVSSLLPVHPSSCRSPLCLYIFLAFYPSCVSRPYTSTEFLTVSIGKLPHLSPMCLVSQRGASQRCIDKQQPCQNRSDMQESIWFHCTCQTPAIASCGLSHFKDMYAIISPVIWLHC